MQRKEQSVKYPTKWMLGKPRGSIKDVKGGFLVRVSPPKIQTISKYFWLKDNNNSVERTMKLAENFMQETSDRYNLTRNQIRYIDKDTIEVQLTQDKTMKTDAKFIDKVQMYPLQAKSRHNKKKNQEDKIYYVYYQDKKKTGKFTDLICDLKIVSFINGDSLDVRSRNIKGMGDVEKEIDVEDEIIDEQYQYFGMKIRDLPKNIWLLGKPAGTIFKRKGENIYSVRVNDAENNQHTRTFNVAKYESDQEAKEDAKKWQIETSYKLCVTKNLIKIIDTFTIEVELSQGRIMKTDKFFIPLLNKINLFLARSGNGMEYAGVYFNDIQMQYHTLITGFPMVDHINGDVLDNRLENLRCSSYAMNNANRHHNEINGQEIGISEVDGIFGKAFVARVKFNGIEYSKQYNIKTYGRDNAKKKAMEFRAKIATCDDIVNEFTEDDDEKLLKFVHIKLNHIIEYSNKNTVRDVNKYLSEIDLDEQTRLRLFGYYIAKQHKYRQTCMESYNYIREILTKKALSLHL